MSSSDSGGARRRGEDAWIEDGSEGSSPRGRRQNTNVDDETPLTTGAQAQGALALKQYWMLHVWLAAGLGLLFVASYPFINESFERMTFTYGWAFNIARTDPTELVEEARASVAVTVSVIFSVLLPFVLAFSFLGGAPRPDERHHKRKPAGSRQGSMAVYALLAAVLTLFLCAASFALNYTDFFQERRLLFCFFIFVMNSLGLGLSNILHHYFDWGATVEQAQLHKFYMQTVLVTVHTIVAMCADLWQSHPGRNLEVTVGDNEREAYIASVGGLGMESFVFLWLSMAISQGLKIIADIATLASRNCSPGAKRVVTALTPKKLYGSNELWVHLILQTEYALCFGYLNLFTLALAAFGMCFYLLSSFVRMKVFNKAYKGTPTLVAEHVPMAMMLFSIINIPVYFVVLIPLGDKFVPALTAATILTVAFLFAFLRYYHARRPRKIAP